VLRERVDALAPLRSQNVFSSKVNQLCATLHKTTFKRMWSDVPQSCPVGFVSIASLRELRGPHDWWPFYRQASSRWTPNMTTSRCSQLPAQPLQCPTITEVLTTDRYVSQWVDQRRSKQCASGCTFSAAMCRRYKIDPCCVHREPRYAVKCPTLEDITLTPLAERWPMWDDPSCASRCTLPANQCGDNAPCCVRSKYVLKWREKRLTRPIGRFRTYI
jgi:hypothetical protein